MPKINIYLVILAMVAAVGMSGVAFATCMQVFRLRNKRMSWRGGTLRGFPLFSSLFLAVSLILAGVVWQFGDGWTIAAAVFYLIFSGSWFVSSYFSSKRYITDHGIVKNVNDPAQTVAWHQVHDFFEQQQDHQWLYIFIYRKKNEDTLKNLIRLQLTIPQRKHAAFKKLISHKLGRRISCYDDSTVDVNQFK